MNTSGYKIISDYGLEELANAIILQAIKDYQNAKECLRFRPDSLDIDTKNKHNKTIKQVTIFINSDWFKVLTEVDPQLILSYLEDN